ncbi:MAG: PAS domain-containing sensor histidine kinase [Thermoplasmatota archaeon]
MPPPPDPEALQAAFRLQGLGAWTYEPATRQLQATPHVAALLGTAEALPGLLERTAVHSPLASPGEPATLDVDLSLADQKRAVRIRGQRQGARWVGTVEDIGAREAAGDERRALLEEATRDYVVYLLDAQGRVASWNAGAERLTGYSAKEALGRPMSSFFPPGEQERAQHTLEGAARDGRHEEEGQRVRKNGERYWVNAVVTARRDEAGRLRGFSKVTHDVTERHLAEQHQREVAQLKEINDLKARFINTAAHELMTPLTPMRVHVALLEEIYGPTLSTDAKMSVAVLKRNLTRLTALVQDVLNAARLQGHTLRVDRKPIDLSALARQVVAGYEAPAREVGVALKIEVPPELRVEADPDRIEQVLVNLLSNALKFTPEGGSVTVRAANDGVAVVLDVTDSGIGMAPEQLARLFLPFSQVHDEKHSKRGTGLGLYICKGIVEQHGGTIEALSDGPGEGTRFRVRLAATNKALPPPVPVRAVAKRFRELI